MSLYDIIGLSGPAMFLYAYAMVALAKWSSERIEFHVLNLLGAIAMLISLSHDMNLPTFLLEICWGSISMVGMWKAKKRELKN